MRHHRSALLLSIATTATVLAGCVTNEHRALLDVREELAACRRAHPDDAAMACAELERTERLRYDRYEDAARHEWGCQPGADDCSDR